MPQPRKTQPKRPRPCQLAVPGSNEKMMAKAADLACDHLFLGLEDAVAPSAKAPAKGQVVQALNSLQWKPKTLSVRILQNIIDKADLIGISLRPANIKP